MDENINKEIKIIIDVLGLGKDEKTQNDLKNIDDSIKAEENLKSLIYFLENFKLDDDNFNNFNNFNYNENMNDNDDIDYANNNLDDNNDKKINSNKKEDLLSEIKMIYKNIQNDIEKENNLNKLEKMGIYNRQNKGLYIEFFNLFNGQKEAIDFLLSKNNNNLGYYRDKIISIDDTLKDTDIDEVDNCIVFFKILKENCKNTLELLEKIRNINENLFNNFKKFIKVLPKLKEIDNSPDNTYNLFIKANKYFSNARYNINLNGENFICINKEPNNYTNVENIINLKEIKSIKYKINIPNEIEIKLNENKEVPEGQEKNSMKTLLLLKYKEVVSNIELIEQFFYVFQKKGCSLPIDIEIIIKYPEIKYFLKKREISFGELSKYLLNVKNYYERTLDANYKKEQNLRFLYGKQFDTLSNSKKFGNIFIYKVYIK